MAKARKPSGISAGWMPAFIFNSLLLLIPLLSVKALASTMPDDNYLENRSAVVLAEARRSIDDTFSSLTANNKRREYWAGLVSEQLTARNMSAARGFLLAAPQMLSSDDARAIRAAAQADPEGNANERLLRASLLFLPSYVRVDYEASLSPKGRDLISQIEADDGETSQSLVRAEASPISASAPVTRISIATMTYKPTFSVLGQVEDLVQNSRAWLRGNRQNEFAVKLTGLAMASPPSATGLSGNRLQTAASVLKTAWKSNRLHPDYASKLSETLQAALPEDVLRTNLELAMADVAPLNVRAVRVQDAFAQSVTPIAAARLGVDLEELAVIAEATSIPGAVSLLEQATDISDLRRARIIAEAGGDRAVALVAHLGPEALALDVQTIRWSQALVLQIMAIVGALIALVLSVLASVQTMFAETRRVKSTKSEQAEPSALPA